MRARRARIRLRQRLQRRLDGFAADDLAVAHEHPVRDVGFAECDLVAYPLAEQITRFVGEHARIGPVRQFLHLGDPDVLAAFAGEKAHFQGVPGFRRLGRLIGRPEGREGAAGACDRGVHLGVGGAHIDNGRAVFGCDLRLGADGQDAEDGDAGDCGEDDPFQGLGKRGCHDRDVRMPRCLGLCRAIMAGRS
ncbi:hypothetical protein ACVIWV_006287 [Bradyrhizobium diazoefficiens]